MGALDFLNNLSFSWANRGSDSLRKAPALKELPGSYLISKAYETLQQAVKDGGTRQKFLSPDVLAQEIYERFRTYYFLWHEGDVIVGDLDITRDGYLLSFTLKYWLEESYSEYVVGITNEFEITIEKGPQCISIASFYVNISGETGCITLATKLSLEYQFKQLPAVVDIFKKYKDSKTLGECVQELQDVLSLGTTFEVSTGDNGNLEFVLEVGSKTFLIGIEEKGVLGSGYKPCIRILVHEQNRIAGALVVIEKEEFKE